MHSVVQNYHLATSISPKKCAPSHIWDVVLGCTRRAKETLRERRMTGPIDCWTTLCSKFFNKRLINNARIRNVSILYEMMYQYLVKIILFYQRKSKKLTILPFREEILGKHSSTSYNYAIMRNLCITFYVAMLSATAYTHRALCHPIWERESRDGEMQRRYHLHASSSGNDREQEYIIGSLNGIRTYFIMEKYM